MTPFTTFFISFSLFLLISVSVSPVRSQAEDRAPHGLSNEDPVSISPSAYDFFHPNEAHEPTSDDSDHLCSSKCSSYSLSAQVRATQVHQPTLPGATPDTRRLGAGAIVGIVLGLAFALFLAMGAYYVVVTRRSNSHKLSSPDV